MDETDRGTRICESLVASGGIAFSRTDLKQTDGMCARLDLRMRVAIQSCAFRKQEEVILSILHDTRILVLCENLSAEQSAVTVSNADEGRSSCWASRPAGA